MFCSDFIRPDVSRKVSIQQQQQLNRKEKKAVIDFGDIKWLFISLDKAHCD